MIKPISISLGSVAAAAAAGSPPAGYPVSIDVIRKHLRVDDDRFDDLVEIFLPGAIEHIEGATHRTIQQREHVWILEDFPRDCQEIRLPRGKTASVKSIVYVSNGDPVTLTGPTSTAPGTDYREDLTGDDGGTILPARGESWPTVDTDHPAPVTVTFTAGPSDLPADLKRAILFLISDQVLIGGTADFGSGKQADTINAIISPYCLHRFY